MSIRSIRITHRTLLGQELLDKGHHSTLELDLVKRPKELLVVGAIPHLDTITPTSIEDARALRRFCDSRLEDLGEPHGPDGFTNYETKIVWEWLKEHPPVLEGWMRRYAEVRANPDPNEFALPDECVRISLVTRLQRYYLDEALPLTEAIAIESLYADLLNHVLRHVNWNQIATRIIERAEG